MEINDLVDIIGRFLVIGWVWVFILEYVMKGYNIGLPPRIIITIFVIWWSLIPIKRNKKENSES